MPVVWTPLVRAYHIRAGHLGYHYATIDLTYNSEKVSLSVEDTGTEVLQVDGMKIIGHLLSEQIISEHKGREITTSAQAMVLQNGSVFTNKSSRGDYSYTTRFVNAEEAREKLGLDE